MSSQEREAYVLVVDSSYPTCVMNGNFYQYVQGTYVVEYYCDNERLCVCIPEDEVDELVGALKLSTAAAWQRVEELRTE